MFNTRIAQGRLLLLDPARGEEKLRESSNSTTAWWRWSSWFSGRASLSTTEEEEELEEERAAPWVKVWLPSHPSTIYRGKGEGGRPPQIQSEEGAAARGVSLPPKARGAPPL